MVSEPVSSAKHVEGSWITSVWMLAESTLLYSPWFSQNRAVSVCNGSMMTRNFSLPSACVTFALFGNESSGLKPWQKYPFILPWCIRSNARRMSYPGTSSFGSHS